MARKTRRSTHAGPTSTTFDDTWNDDPLTRALAPPPNETESERAERLGSETEAKRISDMIDEELNRQRIAERKGPRPVKLLLLGEFGPFRSLLSVVLEALDRDVAAALARGGDGSGVAGAWTQCSAP